MGPRLPHRVGRYLVEEVIGSGGFATVYRARDERLDVDVAVKVLAENHSFDADVRERFVVEGHLLRRIGGQHLVAVHDVGETERQQPFLVLDLADRGDLATRVAARRAAGSPPGMGDLEHLARFLADALSAVHACSVVHRDLAPSNVLLRSGPGATLSSAALGPPDVEPRPTLLDGDERYVLADLGLSKDLARHSGLTVGGGTSGFTPPEQRAEGARVDPRADLWAASALLVWLLTGRAPDDDGRWRRALSERDVPRALVRALARGLERDPAARQPNATAWITEVEAAMSPPAAPVEARGAAPSSAGPAAARRQMWRGPALAAALLGVLALLAAVVIGPLGDPETTSLERLEGGLVRVASPDTAVSIVGPAELEVGTPGRYTAQVAGDRDFVWFAPDGRQHADVPSIVVTPGSAGTATVRVLAPGEDGTPVQVALDVVVRDP